MTHQHLIEGCFQNLEHNDAWPPKRTAVQQQLATSIVNKRLPRLQCDHHPPQYCFLAGHSGQSKLSLQDMPWYDRPRLRKRNISTEGTTRLLGAGGGGARMRKAFHQNSPVQGYLAHKKPCPLWALQRDPECTPMEVLEGERCLMSEVPLYPNSHLPASPADTQLQRGLVLSTGVPRPQEKGHPPRIPLGP